MIRYLTPDDYRVYAAVRMEALATEPDAFGERVESARQRTDSEWEAWLSKVIVPDRKQLIVLEEGARCVGMCGFGLSDDDPACGFLWGMYVARACRRRRFGEMMLSEAEAWVARHGGNRIAARVASPNESAVKFYRKQGYTVGPVSGVLRPGSEIPVYPIEKPLP